MLVDGYKLNIGYFYKIKNVEDDGFEKAILTDIKINSLNFSAIFLTFNGFYKTRDVKSDLMVPIDYMDIGIEVILAMIKVIMDKSSLTEGIYLEEEFSLVVNMFRAFLNSRGIMEDD